MFRKMGVNVVFVCCMALLSVAGAVNYPPLAGAQGVELQGVEPLSVPSADQGTSFTDSSSGVFNGSNAYLFLADICGFAT